MTLAISAIVLGILGAGAGTAVMTDALYDSDNKKAEIEALAAQMAELCKELHKYEDYPQAQEIFQAAMMKHIGDITLATMFT